jgi:hypothetical protein
MITVILCFLYNPPEYRGDHVMMGFMKFLLLAATSFAAFAGDLGGIKTVYLLPMGNGLDQFLANKLTSGSVLQVVTDPQKADAILTDHLGAGFEIKFDELYGGAKKQDDKDMFAPAPRSSSPIKARGAIFLVDRKTRNVIWSDYESVKDTAIPAINRTADKIVTKLAKDIKGN